MDEVLEKVWRFGGEEWMGVFLSRIWRQEGWPESWKEGTIVLRKKKEG